MLKVLSMRDSDRREMAFSRAKELLVPFDFFEPVKILHAFQRESFEKRGLYESSMSDAEMSCSLSHHKIMSDFGTYFIFEDDFFVSQPIPFESIRCFLESTSKPTVVILGHSKTQPRDEFVQNLKQPLMNQIKLDRNVLGENYRINFFGTVGYAVNSAFKDKMRAVETVYWRADDWSEIQRITQCRILHVKQKFIYEDLDVFGSSINNRIHFRHDFSKEPFLNLLKIIRAQIIRFVRPNYFLNNH